MSALIALLIVLLVSCAVGIVSWHLLKPKDVSITDEFKAKYVPGRSRKTAGLVVGASACALVAYGITGQLHLSALALPGGFLVSRALQARREKARLETLRSQYSQVLGVLSSALQGGLSPYQALEDSVPSMPRPARDVFTEILRRTRTGSTFVDAAESVARETGWGELRSLVVALRMYATTGCNLVDVFNHLLIAVSDQENDRRYVSALTAQGRATALVLSLLPFALPGLIRAVAPDFIAPLFATTVGNAILASCVVMVLIGNHIIGKMVDSIAGA